MPETTTVEIVGYSFLTTYEFTPPERGAREKGTGVPLEPDYPASIEILTVCPQDSKIDILELLEQRVIDAIESAVWYSRNSSE